MAAKHYGNTYDFAPVHPKAAPATFSAAPASSDMSQSWGNDDQKPTKTSPPLNTAEYSTHPSAKGNQFTPRAQTAHPLDPLAAAEIAVAVATVRAAGTTPELRDGMRFIEVVLLEPAKSVVALADAYFFPPYQPSLLRRTKGGPVIPSKLPPRQARLVVYNKMSNETSVWVIELSQVHAATRGGQHRGKVVTSKVIKDVQPPMVFPYLYSVTSWKT
ncbi:uncharacterized protein LOC124930125 [Impatiens glandulifera]|uniref:uncharacterized protein LOC124930125 n=1 Tax=Impatiens glandulifera TaxID=253017 RepID=UPI001FB147C4|nr:uncharacterized protein LOC124930125 [Impatiens glandulifera]